MTKELPKPRGYGPKDREIIRKKMIGEKDAELIRLLHSKRTYSFV